MVTRCIAIMCPIYEYKKIRILLSCFWATSKYCLILSTFCTTSFIIQRNIFKMWKTRLMHDSFSPYAKDDPNDDASAFVGSLAAVEFAV